MFYVEIILKYSKVGKNRLFLFLNSYSNVHTTLDTLDDA